MRAPFGLIKDPYSGDRKDVKIASPVLEAHVQQGFGSDSFRGEFEQQHEHHLGQQFAVLRIARYSRALNSQSQKDIIRLPGASLMVVETTGQQENEYRRVEMLSPSVPLFSNLDEADQLLFTEMDKAK